VADLATAPVTADDNRLHAVTMISANDGWAVGESNVFTSTGAVTSGLIEHWNGTAWTKATSPSGEPTGARLLAVSAVSTSDVWAVGAEHWDGTAWTLVPSPTITTNNAQDSLTGGVALSSTDVWAVGQTLANFSTITTLALHWNGTNWQIVSSANRSTTVNVFNAVTGSAPGEPLWAVGQGGNANTLIETTTG